MMATCRALRQSATSHGCSVVAGEERAEGRVAATLTFSPRDGISLLTRQYSHVRVLETAAV